jgi:hypothetical protein
MNRLPNHLCRLRLAPLAEVLADRVYGMGAFVRVEVTPHHAPKRDRYGRRLVSARASVWRGGADFWAGTWHEPEAGKRPPEERALREAIAWLKGYLRIRLDAIERQEILERLARRFS